MTLADELDQLTRTARAHGHTSIDCHTLEQLTNRHQHRPTCESRRIDLLDPSSSVRPPH